MNIVLCVLGALLVIGAIALCLLSFRSTFDSELFDGRDEDL